MKKILTAIITFIFVLTFLQVEASPTNNRTVLALSKDKDFINLVNTTLKYHAKENRELLRELLIGKVTTSSSADFTKKLSSNTGSFQRTNQPIEWRNFCHHPCPRDQGTRDTGRTV